MYQTMVFFFSFFLFFYFFMFFELDIKMSSGGFRHGIRLCRWTDETSCLEY